MKRSPEPDWANGEGIDSGDLSLEDLLQTLLLDIEQYNTLYFMVPGNKGENLGSFTSEWFLDLSKEHQLRFLTVVQRMHEQGQSIDNGVS